LNLLLPPVTVSSRMKGRIRPLTPQDYKSAKDIFEATFKIKMPNSTWRYRNRQRSLGIFNNAGDLLGFILLSGKSYISRIAVHPLFQSLGLGSKLLKAVLTKSCLDRQTVYLTPLNWEKPLMKFYCHHGFYATRGDIMVFHFKNTRRQHLFSRHYDPKPVVKKYDFTINERNYEIKHNWYLFPSFTTHKYTTTL
jgi:GNAT superfamily N-acetyltransferase